MRHPGARHATPLLILLGLGITIVGLVWGVIRDAPPVTACGDPRVPEAVAASYAAPIAPAVLALAAVALATLVVTLRGGATGTSVGPAGAAAVAAVIGLTGAVAVLSIGVEGRGESFPFC